MVLHVNEASEQAILISRTISILCVSYSGSHGLCITTSHIRLKDFHEA